MFNPISNEALVLEAIRRSRIRKIPRATGKYDGSNFSAVLSLLISDPGWMSAVEIRDTLNLLLEHQVIAITCHVVRFTAEGTRLGHTPSLLQTFHPDMTLNSSVFCLSEHGTPLRSFRIKGRRKVHNRQMPYRQFMCQKCYIVADGVPDNLTQKKIAI